MTTVIITAATPIASIKTDFTTIAKIVTAATPISSITTRLL